MNFQDLIFQLERYWAGHGCLVLQPYDMEVGAGTFHAATFLAAIGPEPLRAAYVQASRRPADGRYGENPNRLQRYFQFQVLIKPSPDDFQDLYLGSLAALGVGLQHGYAHTMGFGGGFDSSSLRIPLDLAGLESIKVKLRYMYGSLLVCVVLLMSVNVELIMRAMVKLVAPQRQLPGDDMPADMARAD